MSEQPAPAFRNAKFEATGETKQWLDRTLHRIRAVADITALGIVAGTIGGWIEKEDNLSVSDNAWVSGNARVYKVNLTAVRSDNYTFTIAPTPEGPRIIAGCRYFSFEQAREHWARTRGGTPLGDETMAILDLLEAQSRIHGFDKPVTDAPDA